MVYQVTESFFSASGDEKILRFLREIEDRQILTRFFGVKRQSWGRYLDGRKPASKRFLFPAPEPVLGGHALKFLTIRATRVRISESILFGPFCRWTSIQVAADPWNSWNLRAIFQYFTGYINTNYMQAFCRPFKIHQKLVGGCWMSILYTVPISSLTQRIFSKPAGLEGLEAKNLTDVKKVVVLRQILFCMLSYVFFTYLGC